MGKTFLVHHEATKGTKENQKENKLISGLFFLVFFVFFEPSWLLCLYSSPKFLNILNPTAWLFSGWNWVAMMLSRQIEAQKVTSP